MDSRQVKLFKVEEQSTISKYNLRRNFTLFQKNDIIFLVFITCNKFSIEFYVLSKDC